MNRLITWLCCLLVVSQGGCATSNLWRDNDPRARLFIDHTQITEAQLQAKHVAYERIQTHIWDGYLVQKSRKQKLGDIAILLFATPITVTLDTTMTVVVVGTFILAQGGYLGLVNEVSVEPRRGVDRRAFLFRQLPFNPRVREISSL